MRHTCGHEPPEAPPAAVAGYYVVEPALSHPCSRCRKAADDALAEHEDHADIEGIDYSTAFLDCPHCHPEILDPPRVLATHLLTHKLDVPGCPHCFLKTAS